MEKFKLRLEMPGLRSRIAEMTPGAIQAWEEEEAKLQKVLREKYELTDEPDLCHVLLGEIFNAKEMKDICLQATGSDWPGKVLQISTLRFKGNGDCPKCGYNSMEETTGGYEPAKEEGEWGGFRVLYRTCRNCKHVEYPE